MHCPARRPAGLGGPGVAVVVVVVVVVVGQTGYVPGLAGTQR